MPYSENEKNEIIDETSAAPETQGQAEADSEESGYGAFYTFVYLLGASAIRVNKRFFKGLKRTVMKPLRALAALFRIFSSA